MSWDNPRCANPNGRCVRTPVPLDAITRHWDGLALRRKAVSKPKTREIWLERSWWGAQPYADGRLIIFCHEWAHLEGAECEPCADYGAGVLFRELGYPTTRDALRTLYSTLDNRSPEAAMGAVDAGYHAHTRYPELDAFLYGAEGGDELTGRPRQVVTGYRNNAPFALVVVEVETGHWLAPGPARAYLRGKAAAAAAGVNGSLESAWRSLARQQELERERPEYAAAAGKSPHQRGNAIDVSSTTLAMREVYMGYLQRHGWARLPAEPWHMDYVGVGHIPVTGAVPDEADGSKHGGSKAPLLAAGGLVLALGALALLGG